MKSLRQLSNIISRVRKLVSKTGKDWFLIPIVSNVSIFDNKSGKLKKVGSLVEGEAYNIADNYGNWYKIQFSDYIGYVKKSQTRIVKVKSKKTIKDSQVTNKYFYPISIVNVYSKTTKGNYKLIGKIESNLKYKIIDDKNDMWKILFLGREAYVKKADVIVKDTEDLEKIVLVYKSKDRKELFQKIDPFLIDYSKDSVEHADKILRNSINIKGHEVIQINDGVPWGDESKTRSFQRFLHGHYFINDLSDAYRRNQNKDYVYKGFYIIKDWIERNPYKKSKNPMAWHDETTSKRFKTWVNFFDTAIDVLSDEELVFLLKKLIEHADILASTEFYSKNTNHGMFQDESLLVFCSYFETLQNHDFYYYLALNRLKEYFDFIISKDGVHLEHSPIYHFIIARMIYKLSNFFKINKDLINHKYFLTLYDKMASYATFVLKPNGTLPGIGDTFNGLRGFDDLWTNNGEFLYSSSVGKEGSPPDSSSAYFEGGDYAIIRDDWYKGIEATYIHFTAAYHTGYHKHSDDLSVWLYANGHDIVTEAGPNGYEYKNKFTLFGYSSFAHNTLIVNNKGLPRVDKKYSSTYLLDFNYRDDITNVSGINKRYSNAVHRRELTYNKSSRIFKVFDEISSNNKNKNKNNYKILWHLAENVIPTIHGNEIELSIDNKVQVVLVITSNQTIHISTVYGQQDPVMLGWHIKKKDNPVKTYSLVIDANQMSKEEIVKIESTFTII